MGASYDFHIHSCLSPCAEDEMTPQNIVAYASVVGLDAIAIADHNAIANVPAALELGAAFGVTVVPAIEVQTSEDIHVLALFATYQALSDFFEKIPFFPLQNDPQIFGKQQIYNADDEVVGEEERLLLTASGLGVYELVPLIQAAGGAAVFAHIDREANGVLSILGAVPEDVLVDALEFSPYASDALRGEYANFPSLTNSDAHRLLDIANPTHFLPIAGTSAKEIVDFLRKEPPKG